MRNRLAIILPIYLGIFATSLFIALWTRFEFRWTQEIASLYMMWLPIYLGVKLSLAGLLGEWNRTYRHPTINDLSVLVGTCLLGSLLLLAGRLIVPESPLVLPRSVILIDGLISVILLAGFRIGCRLLWQRTTRERATQRYQAALIYGNDETAIGIWKMLQTSHGDLGRYRIAGFINSGADRQHSLIGGLPVYSPKECFENGLKCPVDHILVPTSTSGRVIHELLHKCQQQSIKLHKIPTVEEIVDGRFRLAVRDLDIDDLLRRPPTQLDLQEISQTITGKTVLVTGGAGSIGSEVCRQILRFHPQRLIVLDHSEYGVFQMEREFDQQDISAELVYITSSILDAVALEQVFHTYKPELVFHAAAYKHVPLMESNPAAAIRNNTLGTKAVVDAAHQHKTERFVLISTDKAVRPTSVMGATKLMAEKYLQAMARHSQTKFITVRFGNVLNSVGSVVPTFRRQIEQGGPITVTHADMVRYFMTIPEAVQLVLQAGAVGQTGNVLILDMGEPVKIVDLAKDMIALSGLHYPEDIDIVFSGLRPGEKMYEELFYQHEVAAEKVHEKIFLGSGYAPGLLEIQNELISLEGRLSQSAGQSRNQLWQIVERYVGLDDQRGRQSQAA